MNDRSDRSIIAAFLEKATIEYLSESVCVCVCVYVCVCVCVGVGACVCACAYEKEINLGTHSVVFKQNCFKSA